MSVPSPVQILYVDDDQDSAEMISFMLHQENEDYCVTTVETAEEALDLREARSFDLYIVDYRLPGMDGIQLCRKIRETDKETPIIFFSGMARDVDRETAIAEGANEYLIKPIGIIKFVETVTRLIDKNSSAEAIG